MEGLAPKISRFHRESQYDWRDHKVQDICEGVFYPTRFASAQRTLFPLTPHDSLVVYHAKPSKRRAPRRASMQQLLLFEVMATG
jgi:hypothetical protein